MIQMQLIRIKLRMLFPKYGCRKIQIQYGASGKTRFIPLHKLSVALEEIKCKAILKSLILSGCDVTNKVGSKAAVLKNLPDNFLQEFGENNDSNIQDSYQEAEKYLVKVWCSSSHSSTFDELR